MDSTLHKVLLAYGHDPSRVAVQTVKSGLINTTWKAVINGDAYILQKVNDHVFRKPSDIAHNISVVSNYLQAVHPDYLFISPIKTHDQEDMVFIQNEGYFRMFPYVPRSHTVGAVETPEQAFQAANQFGLLTRNCSGISLDTLRITIADFHNLEMYFGRFQSACDSGNPNRIAACADLIAELFQQADILATYRKIRNDSGFVRRVTHHDTKISNVLFDPGNKALCVIDLDTIMPGYFISDVGDMMRTYLCPVNEEESDTSKIELIDERFYAMAEGYFSAMQSDLTTLEKQHFFYSGLFMTYMQSLRFLIDYLQNDPYYQIGYPEQNLVRARNQVTLLRRLNEKKRKYQESLSV